METTMHSEGKLFPLGTILLVLSNFSFPMLPERSRALEELLSFMLGHHVQVNELALAKELAGKELFEQLPVLNTEDLGRRIAEVERWCMQGGRTIRQRDTYFSHFVTECVPTYGETLLVRPIAPRS